jgi:hypothetical protein
MARLTDFHRQHPPRKGVSTSPAQSVLAAPHQVGGSIWLSVSHLGPKWKDLVMPREGLNRITSISETNAAVKTTVDTNDAVPKLPRGRYFWYRVTTTDRAELTKTEIWNVQRFYPFYLNQSLSSEAKNHLQPQIWVGTQPNYRSG